MRAIADGDTATTTRLLATTPELASARLLTNATRATADDFFLSHLHMQLYSGDTALHVAAAAYDTVLARNLTQTGADVRARNRRGAEPIHAAVIGVPGSNSWAPQRQVAVIRYLIGAGADPEATAAGGVTPLLRAVRNRCSAAVGALLEAGVDPRRTNEQRVVTARSGPSDLRPRRHRIAGGQGRASEDHPHAGIHGDGGDRAAWRHAVGARVPRCAAWQPFAVVEACRSSVNSNPVPLPLPIGRRRRRVVLAAREVDGPRSCVRRERGSR